MVIRSYDSWVNNSVPISGVGAGVGGWWRECRFTLGSSVLEGKVVLDGNHCPKSKL